MKKEFTCFLILLLFCFNSMNSQTFTPTHRVVIEDQTICATGYGIYCPKGIVRIDSFAKSAFGNLVEVISVHSSFYGPPNDAMEDSAYWYSCFYNSHLSATGWPQFVIDRKRVLDPDSIFYFYNQYAGDSGVADITVSPEYNSVSRELNVTATAHFAVNAVHYNLALVLTEDSVHGTTINYAQRNTYSGGTYGPMAGAGIDFVAQPDPVPASLMYYRHVARAILPSFWGKNGSLPDTMHANSTYSYTFPTYTVPANYNASKMRAIVLLIDTVSGKIKNANGADIADSASGVHEIMSDAPLFSIFPNPFSGETSLKVTLPATESVTIQVSNAFGQSLLGYNIGLMQAGEHIFALNGQEWVAGIYFVTLKTSRGMRTQKIVLNK